MADSWTSSFARNFALYHNVSLKQNSFDDNSICFLLSSGGLAKILLGRLLVSEVDSNAMPKPGTLFAAAELVRRSGLVDPEQLRAIVDAIRSTTELAAPEALLTHLVAVQLLTPFQAAQLAEGRWRGFFVGPYRLTDRIGIGGMGRVYRAESPDGEIVAVKLLDRNLFGDDVAYRRFIREALSAATVEHPNVVRQIRADLAVDPPYLVLEYVDGLPLQTAVAQHGPFNLGLAIECVRQAALGLQAIHDAGLVHRDVKPANLILTPDGCVKVLDLGIVRIIGADSLTDPASAQIVLGTAEYLAPEQANDCSSVDIRADVYALGSTLYFLLTEHPPFTGSSTAEVIRLKQNTDPVELTQLRPEVPQELATVVSRMLSRIPGDRYPSPGEAADALAPWAAVSECDLRKLFARQSTCESDLLSRLLDQNTAHQPSPAGTPTKQIELPNPRDE